MGFPGCMIFAFNPFALIAAVTLGVTLNGTVHQSVLLPASYTISDPSGYLRIRWMKAGTKAGSRIVDYRCTSERGNTLTERCHYLPVPDDYKRRSVLFPQNASLLLEDLQLNDSGTYELSISHPRGTEMARFMLTVQPDTARDGTDTDKKRTPGVEAKVRYLSLVVIVFFLCFTVKTRRGCKKTQKQTQKDNAAQDGQKSTTSDPAVLRSEMKLAESTGAMGRKMYATDENIEHGRIQILRD
ncbi:uncharacterized protein LOC144695355 isoform X1 [Cetorhinus maximus]